MGTVNITTFAGEVHGKRMVHQSGDEIHMYLGIPYAEPPVGQLRFLPPRPAIRYEKFEALEYGPVCPQFDLMEQTFIGLES